MDTMLGLFAFAVAFACVFTMGYAIQRGGTCTVAAVDEIVSSGRMRRLLAMLEASLWVAGSLAIAQALHRLPVMPVSYASNAWTVVGGALLGLGAWLGGACVFGAIARFGSGEWAYAASPVGFWLGCLAVPVLFAPAMPARLDTASPLLAFPAATATVFALYAAWRIASGRRDGSLRDRAARVWAPHAATLVIGVTFVAMLLAVGAWAYTDALAELARGMSRSTPARLALFGALLGGAALGGWTAGRFRPVAVEGSAVARCLAGGALMGAGSVLIPGSNDGLILVGMPLLRPYAWLAFGTMCATIALAKWLQSSQLRHGREPGRGAA